MPMHACLHIMAVTRLICVTGGPVGVFYATTQTKQTLCLQRGLSSSPFSKRWTQGRRGPLEILRASQEECPSPLAPSAEGKG